VRLLATGTTNPEIADALSIGTGTGRNHVAHSLAKLEIKTRTEASGLARRKGARLVPHPAATDDRGGAASTPYVICHPRGRAVPCWPPLNPPPESDTWQASG
jgi:hypothetical protein